MRKGNIILIGFMGSGKTTFGGWLEKTEGKARVDTDEYIVAREGRSINDIFETEGEEYFRKLETEVLREFADRGMDNTVISAGGGLPVREENGVLLKKLGSVVYLRAETDTLVKRLKADRTRPLLRGGNLRQRIEKLMEQREEIYKQRADLILDTDRLTFEEMYERIVEYENSCN